ncbi:site-specific integrase [Vibrio astriarenae]|uniref:site-specific integrase n=1 Tax=Vibrio astriarenae TaxID=1481923 RepID=UPI0037359EFE
MAVQKNKNIAHDSPFTQEQENQINALKLPTKVTKYPKIRVNDELIIDPSSDNWSVRFGTGRRNFDFNAIDSSIARRLIKLYIIDEIKRKGSSQCFSYHGFLVSVFNNQPFTLTGWIDGYLARNHTSYYRTLKNWLDWLHDNKFHGFTDKKAIKKQLEDIAPESRSKFGVYLDTDNAFSPQEKRLIHHGIIDACKEMQESPSSRSSENIEMWAAFALLYETGLRAVQMDELTLESFTRAPIDEANEVYVYDITLLYAKQKNGRKRKTSTISLSQECGYFLTQLQQEARSANRSTLFDNSTGKSKTNYLTRDVIPPCLYFCQPKNIQKLIDDGEIFIPEKTPSDFRHNTGHSMAMAGASAEEIAYVMTHSSTQAAQFYISANPDIALWKLYALGENPVWQEMVSLLQTGSVVDMANWNGKVVSGIAGGELHLCVGGCTREGECHLAKVRSCYDCLYFRPSDDKNVHQKVLRSLESELINTVEIAEQSGSNNNPNLHEMATTKTAVQIVLSVLGEYQNEGE